MGLDVRELALESLSISPLNVRKDVGDLTELISSITDVGVLEPIVVRPMGEGYEVIAGSRRTAAAREAGLMTIPAMVVEVTDAQAKRISVIENLHRKGITLEERVAGYKELQDLDPARSSHRELAKVIGVSHQKITQDFQAYEMLLKLQPLGIRVASDLPPDSEERQRGEVLPEYHAVLLHQAMSYVTADEEGTGAATDGKLAELAQTLTFMSQAAAKAYIAALKDGQESLEVPASQCVEEEQTPPWQVTSDQRGASHASKPPAKGKKPGSVVVCAYCKQELRLVHRANDSHWVINQPIHLENQQEPPGHSL
jgi:ParB/RepB/Spo0J family partition protein